MPELPALALVCPFDEPRAAARQLAAGAEAAARAGPGVRCVALDGAPRGPAGGGGSELAEPWSLALPLERLARTLAEPAVAFLPPGARPCPDALARARAHLRAGADAVLADLLLVDAEGKPLERASPAAMGEAPGPGWTAGFALRREHLRGLWPEAGLPWALALLRDLRARGATIVHEAEPAALYPLERWRRALEASVVDAGLVTLARRAAEPRPALSVLIEARSLAGARPALVALARQLLVPGRFEVLLLERQSAPPEPLPRFPFPLRRVRGRGGHVPWNAGVALARGSTLFFLSERSLADPGCVEAHLFAQGRGPALVRGAARAPEDEAGDALGRWWGRAGGRDLVLGGAENLSVPRACVRLAGGVHEELGPRALAELAERLVRAGLEERSAERAWIAPLRPPSLAELVERLGVDDAPAALPLARGLDALGSLDLAALTALGASYAELARRVAGRFDQRIDELAGRLRATPAEPASAPAPLRLRRRAPRAREPELSVIVPTHGRPRELAGLLEALARQTLEPERFEVLVVDDGSAPPAAEALAGAGFPFALRLLRQEQGGPGAARNRGLARARAARLVFFNDDALPAPGCLARHLLRQRLAAEPTAVLGSFALLERHRRDSLALYLEEGTSLFAQGTMRAGVRYHGLALCTGNVSLPRALVEAVGGFDEALPYAGGEDSELGLRLERRFGLRVLFDPLAAAGHDHAMEVRALLGRKRVVGWSAWRIQERHGDLGLLPIGWPADAATRAELARTVAQGSPSLEPIAARAEALCAEERARGTAGAALAALRQLLPPAEDLALLEGALAAAEGRSPRECALVPPA